MPSASHRLTAHPSSSDQESRTRRGKDTSKEVGHLAPTAPGTHLSNCSLVAYRFRTRFDEEPSESYPGPRCHFGDAAFLFWNYKLTRTVPRLTLKLALTW